MVIGNKRSRSATTTEEDELSIITVSTATDRTNTSYFTTIITRATDKVEAEEDSIPTDNRIEEEEVTTCILITTSNTAVIQSSITQYITTVITCSTDESA